MPRGEQSVSHVSQNLFIQLSLGLHSERSWHINELQKTLTTVELAIELKFGQTDRAERFVFHTSALKAAIGAIHSALVINTMLQAKHMSYFMHHRGTGARYPLCLDLLLVEAFIRRDPCMSTERKDTTLILRWCESEDEVPLVTWIQVCVCHCENAVSVIDTILFQSLDYVTCVDLK